MNDVVEEILDWLRTHDDLGPAELDRILRKHSKQAHDGRRRIAKKHVLPYYLAARRENTAEFRAWNVDAELDEKLVSALKMKPRRTASGVATITVITKPWPCASNCLYCPCDVRMPKSYLHDEPACQRAERNFFDPYLQVASRLEALERMGHATDKVELIVLGGSWTDYPASYRTWFVHELFRALDDDDNARADNARKRRELYRNAGIFDDAEVLEKRCEQTQRLVDSAKTTYNAAVKALYQNDSTWMRASAEQHAYPDALEALHAKNEEAAHRVVGLVVETRPDALDLAALVELRLLGCTKIQMGLQSLDDRTLALNGRQSSCDDIARAFELSRLMGFKTHAHFMLNLFGSSPADDKRDYRMLVEDPRFLPDEVKLYPCALVKGTKLVACHEAGSWRPYSEAELLDVLEADMMATPAYTRVSRMIRDISASDIMVGNRKTNLRQLVDADLARSADEIHEIRFREIGIEGADLDELSLTETAYETSVTDERFLEWVTPGGKIAGFLRLSLPKTEPLARLITNGPVHPGEAMIREVHVYGFAARLNGESQSAQHHGLGSKLVARACEIAADEGYAAINVISAVGTRGYYRRLGFEDAGLYQRRPL